MVGVAIYLAVLWVVVDDVAIPCYKVAPTVSLMVGRLDVDDKAALLLLQQAKLYPSLLAVFVIDTLELHAMLFKDPAYVFDCWLSLIRYHCQQRRKKQWGLVLGL